MIALQTLGTIYHPSPSFPFNLVTTLGQVVIHQGDMILRVTAIATVGAIKTVITTGVSEVGIMKTKDTGKGNTTTARVVGLIVTTEETGDRIAAGTAEGTIEIDMDRSTEDRMHETVTSVFICTFVSFKDNYPLSAPFLIGCNNNFPCKRAPPLAGHVTLGFNFRFLFHVKSCLS
jgi:hypothetical protein